MPKLIQSFQFSTPFLVCLFASFGLGCGKANSTNPVSYSYSGSGNYSADQGEITYKIDSSKLFSAQVPKVTKDQRDSYCAVYTTAEPDSAVKDQFLQSISAAWRRHNAATVRPARSTFSDGTKEDVYNLAGEAFTLDFTHHRAARSDGFFKSQQITFKRTCLSLPIKNGSPYDGFRILELVSDQNEGIAVMAVKLENSTLGLANSTLFVTHYRYSRFGSTDDLMSELAVFQSKDKTSAVKVEVYPYQM